VNLKEMKTAIHQQFANLNSVFVFLQPHYNQKPKHLIKPQNLQSKSVDFAAKSVSKQILQLLPEWCIASTLSVS